VFPVILLALAAAPMSPGLSPAAARELSAAVDGQQRCSTDGGQIWRIARQNPAQPANATSRCDDLYQLLATFSLQTGTMAAAFGDIDGDTLPEIYVEDYPAGSIMCYELDADLVPAVTSALEYGMPWLLADIDGDGQPELAAQRGDSGMSGDGYLDIHAASASGFPLLQRFTFPNRKMIYTPRAFDLDGDGVNELVFTTMVTFADQSEVRVIRWNPLMSAFELSVTFPLFKAYGGIAGGDFDHDGQRELIVGADGHYAHLEYVSGTLETRGVIGDNIGSSILALEWSPEGTDDWRAVLATSISGRNPLWRYEVQRNAGPDTFALETVFELSTPYIGLVFGGVADTDNDGREEALLSLYPYARLYEWTSAGYELTWEFDQINDTGTIQTPVIPAWDVNNDGYQEWIIIDHLQQVHIFGYAGSEPTASPTLTPEPSPTHTPSPLPSDTPTSSPSATPSIPPSPTSSPTPTASPTNSPTPTPTLAPSATEAPGETPSPRPTETATPTPTTAPTATPVILGVRIELARPYVSPGQEFWIRGYLDNPGPEPLTATPVFFILDVAGMLYFWPEWTMYAPPEHTGISYGARDVPLGTTEVQPVPPFIWPDTGESSLAGIGFWGAMTDPSITTLLGQAAYQQWGYGPTADRGSVTLSGVGF